MIENILSKLFLALFFILVFSYSFSRLLHKYGIPGIISPLLLGFFFTIFKGLIDVSSLEEIFSAISELALIFLLLLAGLDLDIRELKKISMFGGVLAFSSMFFPLILGYLYATNLGYSFLTAIVLGLSISVTAEGVLIGMFEELDIMKSRLATLTVEIATIDDIFETVLILLVSTMGMGSENIFNSLLQMLIFIPTIVLIYSFMNTFMGKVLKTATKEYERYMLIFALIFFIAAISYYFNIGMALGSFLAGVIIKNVLERIGDLEEEKRFQSTLEDITMGLLAPVFFFYIGFQMDVKLIKDISLFVGLLIIAVIGKLLGSLIPYLVLDRKNLEEGLVLGIGLNIRGIMEIVAASIGYKFGVLSGSLFSSIVLVSIVTTVLSIVMFTITLKDYTKKIKKWIEIS